jgi:hypothetical protein
LQVCDNISLYLDDGYYELLLYANDSYGNLNSTGVNFTVDTHAPVTVLNSPADGSYLSVTDITLNQTTTDNIFLTTDCIMQLTGYAPYLFTAINNTPFLTPISSIPENTYYWNVTCTDDAGNSAIDSNGTWSFTIDRTEPYLEIISPTSTSYNTSTVNLNFTVSDTNLDSCWYVLDDNAPVYSCNNDTLDSLSEGEHNVTVYANDSAGNTNSTDTVYFTVDTIPPSVSLFNPINGFNTTYTSPGVVSVFFNFTATDATSGIDNCTWYFDGSAGNNYTEPFYFAWAVVSPSAFETMHNWSIYCVDNAGNGQMSEVWNFTVDVSAPNLTIEAPINITYNSSDVPLNFTVSDNFDLDQCWYILDSDPAQYGCDNSTLESLDDGLHNITVYANDSLNNINSTSSVFFTVDTTSPSLVLVTPINKTYSTLDVPLSFIVSDLIDLDQCWYVLDSNPAVFGCNNRTLESLSQETHLLYLYANDSVNNTNSTNVTFSVELPEEDTPEEEQDESISISFSQQCPENLLEVEVSSGDNTEVNLIMYSPYGGSVDSDTTDGNSVVFSITSSATYQAIASKSGYVSSSAYFEYELCDLVPDDSSNETSDQTDDDEPDETNQTTNQTEDDTTDQTSNQSSNQTTNETSDMQSDAETALEQAQDAIDNAKAAGKDTSRAENKLAEAWEEYNSGNYEAATSLSESALILAQNSASTTSSDQEPSSSGDTSAQSTPIPSTYLFFVIILFAIIAFILFIMRRKAKNA